MVGKDSNEVNVASRLIRVFLTHLLYDHDWEMAQSKHTWLSHYNFLCLLNLPNEIDELGPLRNRWEGGVRGEGFLRVVKPMVLGTSRPNWQKNLLSNLVKHKSMMVLSGMDKTGTESDSPLDLNCVKLYGCEAEILASIAEYEPLNQ